MSTNERHRAWVEIRADALTRNARAISRAVGGAVALIPMVKADAYGLGVAGALRALGPLDPWGYGVATADEGAELRRLGVERPVLVASPLPPDANEVAVAAGLEVGVSSVGGLRRLLDAAERAGRRAAFHVEVDTGMGRAGFDWRDVDGWAPHVHAAAEAARWAGCYTHLHSADQEGASVHRQIERFRQVLEALRPPAEVLLHVHNSAGALRAPEHPFHAVRPGIFLYGGRAGEGLPEPEPVVALRARVVHLKDARPGDTVGYGATYRAEGPERWATLSVGYGDGLPRALGSRGAALLHGGRARIVGRISMDVTVVDITHIPGVEPGDVATLIGSDGGEQITLDEVAEQAGTISYEILTGLSRRLPRVWLESHGR